MQIRVPDGSPRRYDWKSEKGQVDLAGVMARLLGPPAKKSGGRLWWPCAFHEDKTPSLFMKPGRAYWRCYGCDAKGDVVDLVMRLEGLTFPEATAWLLGEPLPAGRTPAPRPAPRPKPEPPARPEGWPAFALRLVAQAEESLWSDRGGDARAYLRGRGLTDETVKRARLGLLENDSFHDGVFPDKLVCSPAGVVIPWFEGGEVVMVNVRRPDGSTPKYWAVRGSRRGGPYPGRSGVSPGMPVVIAEGEFEALLLNQALDGLAPAVTFGSAGDRPSRRQLDPLLAAAPWYVATDADAAGDASADAWSLTSARCRRVRPPARHKDWTEAAQAGVDLRRWWGELLSGNPKPDLYSWEELREWRWGDADDSPGLDVPPIVYPAVGAGS